MRQHSQDFKNNPVRLGHHSESSIGDTVLSAPAAVFSGKLKKPKKGEKHQPAVALKIGCISGCSPGRS